MVLFLQYALRMTAPDFVFLALTDTTGGNQKSGITTVVLICCYRYFSTHICNILNF